MTRRRWPALALAGALACQGEARRAGDAAAAPAAVAAAQPPASPAVGGDSARACGIGTGYDVAPGAVGALRVGLGEAELRRACTVVRDTTQLDDEALPERVLTVQTPRGAIDATVDSGRVWRLAIRDPRLRTADSLGVGSTLGALLRRPGTRGVEGEAGLFVVPGGRCGLSFHLEYEVADDQHQDEWSGQALGQLPPNTRVDEVLVHACPTP